MVKGKESGFTLIEMLIAMTIGLIVLGALVSTFIMQRKTYDVQEQVTEMIQSARAAMDMMTREIRMAGYYDPTVSTMQRSDPTDTATFVGIPYDANQLQIVADFRGTNPSDPPDGAADDANENIIYAFDAANYQIDRNTQPFAENIQSFTFAYLTSPGNPTTITGAIRQIQITIVARTADPDTDYSGGYRTYTLTSLITPRNLDY